MADGRRIRRIQFSLGRLFVATSIFAVSIVAVSFILRLSEDPDVVDLYLLGEVAGGLWGISIGALNGDRRHVVFGLFAGVITGPLVIYGLIYLMTPWKLYA